MVRFENVSFSHPTRTSGLKDISLSIEKGDFVFITAPVAEYKTTLLNLIYGSIFPGSGRLHVLEYILPDDRKKVCQMRKQIGFIFHDFHFFDHLTVRENLLVTLLVKSREDGLNYMTERVDKLLMEHHFLKHDMPVSRLSSGEKQLLNVLRAVACSPLIILADEPFKNLSRDETDKIMAILEEENRRGITIIATCGSPSIPKTYNKEYLILKGGKIIQK